MRVLITVLVLAAIILPVSSTAAVRFSATIPALTQPGEWECVAYEPNSAFAFSTGPQWGLLSIEPDSSELLLTTTLTEPDASILSVTIHLTLYESIYTDTIIEVTQ